MTTACPTIEPDSIARLVSERYDLGPVSTCRHLFSSINHTYSVHAGDGSWAARVHGDKWWISSESDLLFELDLLDHLHARGVPVSYPITTRDGRRLITIDTLAGPRCFVLFSWAPGKPDAQTCGRVFRVGATMAEIHVAAETFQTENPRYRMDLSTLLDRFLDRLWPR